MAEPWFEPGTFGAWFGAIVGGGGGTLGGLLGAAIGILAPRGKCRRVLMTCTGAFIAIGIAMLAVGVYALLAGQPYGIWYPMLLSGAIFTLVMGSLIPVVRIRFREAEMRRITAESIRTS
ncbi:MAG: hypothetical protein WDZ59_12780 [Pirellulales bacterium]